MLQEPAVHPAAGTGAGGGGLRRALGAHYLNLVLHIYCPLCCRNLSCMKQLGSETAVVAIDVCSERNHSKLLHTSCVNMSCRNLSYIKQLGPETAVVAIDARSERTRERVLDTPSWLEVFHRVGGLPRSMRHVIVMLPPPLHYPSVNLYLFPSFPVVPVRWHLPMFLRHAPRHRHAAAAAALPLGASSFLASYLVHACRRRFCLSAARVTPSLCCPAAALTPRGLPDPVLC